MSIDNMRDSDGFLWCAVACEFSREAFARDNLRRDGFDVWWPHYVKMTLGVPGRRRQYQVKRSLFAGYLFAGMEDPGDVGLIAGDHTGRIQGVIDIARAGQRPLFADPVEITDWRSRGEVFDPPSWVMPAPGYVPALDDTVRVRIGGRELEATVVHISGSHIRVQLNGDGLLRLPILVEAAQLEPVRRAS